MYACKVNTYVEETQKCPKPIEQTKTQKHTMHRAAFFFLKMQGFFLPGCKHMSLKF